VNLISNAIDSFEDMGKEILKRVQDDNRKREIKLNIKQIGSNAEIVISDNGCGIPYKMQKEVFVSGFSTKGASGSGYGLHITKQVIENQYSGSIELISKLGEGTEVKLILPVK